VQPEPRPVQLGTVLAAVQTAARRLRRWPTASLDRGCARRSAGRQVGTKGWVCPIEQRDASFDPGSASPPAMTNLLNFAHTTLNCLDDYAIDRNNCNQCYDYPSDLRYAIEVQATEWQVARNRLRRPRGGGSAQ